MPTLFSPFQLKDATLRKRIVIPPMCQYSATDGLTNDWRQTHYGSLARGGAGLVMDWLAAVVAVVADYAGTGAAAGLGER